MKTAFQIPVPTAANSPLHLLLEIGQSVFSAAWYSNNPLTLQGVTVLHFKNDDELDAALPQQLSAIRTAASLPQSVTCFVNNAASVLLPEQMAGKAEVSHLLSLMHGELDGVETTSEAIPSRQLVNAYALPLSLKQKVGEVFPTASFKHASTGLLAEAAAADNLLQCLLYPHVARVILEKSNALQLLQTFQYETPDDLLYYLLNCAERHQLTVHQLRLRVSGLLQKDSPLYGKLKQYFPLIETAQLPSGAAVSTEMASLPPHLFSHLLQLAASCAS